MVDPKVDHSLISTDNGLLNIDLSPFFNIGFGDDLTVDDYVDRVSFLLAETIVLRLGIHHWYQTHHPDAPLHPSYAALQSLHRAEHVPDSPTTVVIEDCPSPSSGSSEGLWGNYSIPKDNPFTDDGQLQPEIWALGLSNPWRSSFDSKRPSYFFCADVGEDTYEEVNLISKGGNYGWRVFEGHDEFHPKSSPGGNTSVNLINPIFPILGYTHSSVSSNVRSASITGGYVYRANTDPCLYGRYLYADLYGSALWVGTETPQGSGNYSSTKLPFDCAKSTPIACDSVEGSPLPSMGIIYSFAEDNNKDVYLLASKGVYRVVVPSQCSYICSKENHVDNGTPRPDYSPSTGHFEKLQLKLVLFLTSFIILLSSH